MGKIFISSTLAWIIPDSGEKLIKVIFDPPKWQVEEQDDEKRLVFSRKLTEEELAELKTELGINTEDDKIGICYADDVDLSNSNFLKFLKEE